MLSGDGTGWPKKARYKFYPCGDRGSVNFGQNMLTDLSNHYVLE